MGQGDIKKALTSYLIGLNLGIQLNFPNKTSKDPSGLPSGDVTFHFTNPSVATLGDSGDDNHVGFMQILLKYPLDTGDGAIMEMADGIRSNFKAGRVCQYGDQKVTFSSCGIGNFDTLDGKFVNPITINWYARTRR